MLSRQLRRVVLEGRVSLPPAFLCPWTASLTTEAHAPATSPQRPQSLSTSLPPRGISSHVSPQEAPARHVLPLTRPSSSLPTARATKFHDSITTYLPLLKAQKQIYANIHIHAKSYLITQGDTIRLPFLMAGVEPGDVLRLNRAVTLGSRDFTLRSPGRIKRGKSSTAGSEVVFDPTPASHPLLGSGKRTSGPQSTASATQAGAEGVMAEEEGEVFVPHLMAGQIAYLDDRLFVCRAVVMGVESEPLRVVEKTKRRQRHVRQVKSKHRYTLLRIKELTVRSLEEVEEVVAQQAQKRAGKQARFARAKASVVVKADGDGEVLAGVGSTTATPTGSAISPEPPGQAST